jgi:hypothetical protein
MVPTSARGFSLFGTWSSWVRVGYTYTLDRWFSIKFDPQGKVLKKITDPYLGFLKKRVPRNYPNKLVISLGPPIS